MNSGLFPSNYACVCETAYLVGKCFSSPFGISKKRERKKLKIQDQISQLWNPFKALLFDWNSEIRILVSKSRFPTRMHLELKDKGEETFFFVAIFLLKVLRLTDPSYLLKKLKLREETDAGAEASSNDEKPEEVSSVSACEFHFSLKFLLISESSSFLFYYYYLFLGWGLD